MSAARPSLLESVVFFRIAEVVCTPRRVFDYGEETVTVVADDCVEPFGALDLVVLGLVVLGFGAFRAFGFVIFGFVIFGFGVYVALA